MNDPKTFDTDPEAPGKAIWAFYITARDINKAKRMRKHLAQAAPGAAGKAFLQTPIKVMPKVEKNRMYAVDSYGKPELVINLKTGSVDFVGEEKYNVK